MANLELGLAVQNASANNSIRQTDGLFASLGRSVRSIEQSSRTASAGMVRDLRTIGRHVQRLGNTVNNAFGTAFKVSMAGAAGAVALVTLELRNLTRTAGELDKISRSTGVAVNSLQQWSRHLGTIGSDINSFSQYFIKLNDTLARAVDGDDGAVKAFDRLGVSIDDGNGYLRETDAIMKDIIKTSSQLNQVERSARLRDVFGRSHAGISALASQGNAVVQIESAPSQDPAVNRAFLHMRDTLDEMWATIRDVTTPYLGGLSLVVTNISNAITHFFGTQQPKSLTESVNILRSAFITVGRTIVNGLEVLGNGMVALLDSLNDNLGGLLQRGFISIVAVLVGMSTNLGKALGPLAGIGMAINSAINVFSAMYEHANVNFSPFASPSEKAAGRLAISERYQKVMIDNIKELKQSLQDAYSTRDVMIEQELTGLPEYAELMRKITEGERSLARRKERLDEMQNTMSEEQLKRRQELSAKLNRETEAFNESVSHLTPIIERYNAKISELEKENLTDAEMRGREQQISRRLGSHEAQDEYDVLYRQHRDRVRQWEREANDILLQHSKTTMPTFGEVVEELKGDITVLAITAATKGAGTLLKHAASKSRDKAKELIHTAEAMTEGLPTPEGQQQPPWNTKAHQKEAFDYSKTLHMQAHNKTANAIKFKKMADNAFTASAIGLLGMEGFNLFQKLGDPIGKLPDSLFSLSDKIDDNLDNIADFLFHIQDGVYKFIEHKELKTSYSGSREDDSSSDEQEQEVHVRVRFGISDEDIKAFMEQWDLRAWWDKLGFYADFGTMLTGQMMSLSNELETSRQRQAQERIEKIREEQDEEVRVFHGSLREKLAMEKRHNDELDREQQKAKKGRKAIMISDIIANQAAALANVWTAATRLMIRSRTAGVAFGATMSALTLATMGAQINNIQALRDGGVVGEHWAGATNGPDNTIVHARKGEMFFNASQQRELYEIANGRGKNKGSGPIQISHSVVIEGNVTDEKLEQLNRNEAEFLDKLERGVTTLKRYGRI